MTSDVVPTGAGAPVPTGAGAPAVTSVMGLRSGLSFTDLVQEAAQQGTLDFVDGSMLEKDKANLIGVPFIITHVNFYPSDKVRKTSRGNETTHFVAATVIVADQTTLREAIARGMVHNPEAVIPNAQYVVNFGGAGAARDIVRYLEAKGLILVGSELPDQGPVGECRYDNFFGTWEIGGDLAEDGWDVRFLAPRGLRVSEYSNEFSDGAETYYFA